MGLRGVTRGETLQKFWAHVGLNLIPALGEPLPKFRAHVGLSLCRVLGEPLPKFWIHVGLNLTQWRHVSMIMPRTTTMTGRTGSMQAAYSRALHLAHAFDSRTPR